MSLKPKVLLSLLTDQEEFQRMQADAARSAAMREAIDLEIAFADNSPVVQIQQIYRAVNGPEESRPRAIVIQAVAMTGVEGAARTAVEAGIGWVLLSEGAPYLEALRRDHPLRLVACIAVDNEEVGRLQGRILRALLPSGGRVLCVDGPSMSGATQNRRKGLEAELTPLTQVRIAKTLTADWTVAGAERVLSSWLRHAPEGAKPAAFVAQNDDMAEGVTAAVAKVRPAWADVPVTGCDGLPERGLGLVRERKLAATIIIPPRAGIAVEAVAKHLRGQPVPFAGAVTPHPFPPLKALGRRMGEPPPSPSPGTQRV
jgi:ABC-type sugar transport system substrate-binding protein